MSKFKVNEKVRVMSWDEAIKTEFNMASYYVCDINYNDWIKYLENKIITITEICEKEGPYSKIQDYYTDNDYTLPEELLIS
jgi:hypothetical protein